MKKSIFVAIAFIAATSITSQLFAQDAAGAKAGYNVKANVKCRVISTDGGCSIVFENNVSSPRDLATGQSSGKRQHGSVTIVKEFTVSSSDNAVAEVKSPRDVASGQATGKRQHKPMTITKELDKSSPMLAKTSSSSDVASSEIAIDEPGVQSKVSMQDFHFTVRCGGKSTQLLCNDGECEIPTSECPNGECSLIASWSWGMSNSGGSSTGSAGSGRCSVDFLLEIEDGVCTAMAINEKGLPGGKGTTKK